MSSALATELLRAHVNECAAPPLLPGQQLERLSQSARNSKVRDLEVAALIYHQVSRLQIAMDDAGAIVRVIERITKLSEPARQLVRPKHFCPLPYSRNVASATSPERWSLTSRM